MSEVAKKQKTEEGSVVTKVESTEVSETAAPVTAEVKDIGVTEPRVGITEYISPGLAGFRGILKQRYSDFMVNEIGLDGQVVHLTDTGAPGAQDRRRERREAERAEEEAKKEKEAEEEEEAKPKFVVSPENTEKLLNVFSQADIDNMVALFNTGTKMETEKGYDDKETRTAIHQTIREVFEGKLETKTSADNKFIITLASGNPRYSRTAREKLNKMYGPKKEFVHFSLYKENKETMEAVNLISKFLKAKPSQFTYAGTKDKRGVTVQKMTARGISGGVERVKGLNKTLRGMKLGSFAYSDEHLRLGDLEGNEFIITIREIDGKQSEIDAALTSLKEHGFINYYGMQRFGTFSISTHEVGRHVLASQWDEVVDMLLRPQELALEESKEARQIWKDTKDAGKALTKMPFRCAAECAILKALKNDPNSLNAVNRIPRNLRIMYGHAYQSYVWNAVVSKRVAMGLKVVEGDLVIDDNANKDGKIEDSNEESGQDLKIDPFTRARPITAEEIASNKFSIYDIVLPTPGHDVIYPTHLEEEYKNIMAKDNLDPHKMARTIRDYSLAGGYRHVFAKPSGVEWFFEKYSNPVEQFVNTDLDMLEKGVDRYTHCDEQDGDKLGLVLKLQLGSAQYATMALREVMKVDTSRRSDSFNVRV
ncbi:pseudouridine synthase [Yarrowia lipolytica]|nr:pseudouridine synthase [Yarrowia lipolytica]VBB87554.1 Pseudouridine synthase, putative [Yarrowia lipolytica]